MMAYFTIYLIAVILAASLATGLAHIKHRTWLLWGTICIFFPPAVFILLFLSKREGPAPYEDESNDEEFNDTERDEGWFYW
jgi:hypothetical protein